ncbi:amiloride-sensitive sodium channel subunit gamma-like [Varroa jacobsoni]|uniref:Uncharacterized protein n=1 Tax=Varroa destructor TaxID=109461 RepID=A0A7M7M631_VARDE|nr:amiloride-sensitive sodium channel subunit gamma-like [Varroa destructor]XP_022711509.1 amiloride-sensitive sodium channel subunit gamma-like [Varroa jacobsoni]
MGRISPLVMATPVSRAPWWETWLKSLQRLWWTSEQASRPLRRIYARNFFVSTIPAADVLASPHSERIRKTIWFVSCVPLIYLTLNDLNGVLNEYNKHPVIYTYEYQTNNTLTFPDVTICNVNQFVRNRFCDRSGPAWSQVDAVTPAPEQTAGDGDEKSSTKWSPFCEQNQRTKILCEYLCGYSETVPSSMTRSMGYLTQWIKKMSALGNFTQNLLYDMGHSLKDTIDKCSYATNTECGEGSPEDFFSLDINDIYGPCFCFHCIETQHPDYYIYGTLSSPLSGLVLTLNTELEEYFNHSREVGFVAMIHEHGKKYSLGSDAIFVPPGYSTYIGLEMSQSTSLEKPYENPCIREWPEMFMSENSVVEEGVERTSYMREDCLNYCLVSLMIDKCACIPSDVSVKINSRKVEDFKYCSGSKLKCYKKIKAQYSRYKLEERCGCLQECVLKFYRTDVSIANFIPNATSVEYKEGGLEHRMAQARLVVHFHSFTYEHVRAMPKYTSVRVLGTIGAINGMYMGISFFVIYQTLDILIFSTYDYLQKQRQPQIEYSKTNSTAIQVLSAELCSPRNKVNSLQSHARPIITGRKILSRT